MATAGVLLFVFAGLSIIVGVLFLFAASAASSVDLPGFGALGGAVAFIGLVFLAMGGLDIAIGIKIRVARAWARVTAIVLSSLWLILWFISLFSSKTSTTTSSGTNSSRGGGVVFSLILLAATATIIYLLAFDKTAKDFFAGRR